MCSVLKTKGVFHLMTLALAIMALLVPVLAPMSVHAETPLVMDGKTSLFQRVLTRSETPRRSAPGGTANSRIEALAPLYVFETLSEGGVEWLRVASDIKGTDAFWIRREDSYVWNQNIVLTFERHGDLDRMLLFRDADDVFAVVESELPAVVANEARATALKAERSGTDAGSIVALGPRRIVDLTKNFYFLPILQWEEGVFETGGGGFVNVLEVAVAKDKPKRTDSDPVIDSSSTDDPGKDAEVLKDLDIGIAFVVDTTISMDKYIAATQKVVLSMFDQLSTSKAGDQINFGLIGFRDSLTAAPKAGYLAETFVGFDKRRSKSTFAAGMSRMAEATYPTRNFREDSFAGIQMALNQYRKSDLDGFWIILITDASPRDASDRFSSTKRSAEGIANFAQESGAYIATLHLKTAAGKDTKDHARAEQIYSRLSEVRNEGALYWSVPEGNVRAFEAAARDLATVISNDIATAVHSEKIVLDPEVAISDPSEDAERDAFLKRAGRVAKAMRLSFLGRETSAEAPEVFSAWIADRDFAKRGLKPVEIRLLLTKNQLSDLETALRTIVDKGEENILEPDQFFRQVVAASADMSRRPEAIAARPDTLADGALISDYLEGLPYRSGVMNVTERDWARMDAVEQLEFMDRLSERAERYRVLHNSPELWVEIIRDGVGETVYPMLLNDLP